MVQRVKTYLTPQQIQELLDCDIDKRIRNRIVSKVQGSFKGRSRSFWFTFDQCESITDATENQDLIKSIYKHMNKWKDIHAFMGGKFKECLSLTELEDKEEIIKNRTVKFGNFLYKRALEHFGLEMNRGLCVQFNKKPKARSFGGCIRSKGTAYINIAIADHINNFKVYDFEYQSISNDPVIGEIGLVHWKKALDCVIAHEVAHAVQHTVIWLPVRHKVGKEKCPEKRHLYKSHGTGWRTVYSYLRRNFVNLETPYEM